MEKRNFVTSVRTTDSSVDDDAMLKSAADMFSVERHDDGKCGRDDDFVKKASEEDEKTDKIV